MCVRACVCICKHITNRLFLQINKTQLVVPYHITNTHITWNDICGLNNVKEELKKRIQKISEATTATEHELLSPEKVGFWGGFFQTKGILFYGPSGCGKTLLAKAAANYFQASFISVKVFYALCIFFF